MELSSKILSDLIIYSKYARYLPNEHRRETWEEIVGRNKQMHIDKFPKLEEEINSVYRFVYEKKVLPSMRSLQFSGKPAKVNPCRIFNCSYLPINDWRAFSEVMFLLLSGVGVGISVQKHHIEELPEVKRPLKKKRRYLVGDSVEGWADAVRALIKSYFFSRSTIEFDYSDIRSKGTKLVTSGGKAPGAQPLRDCIHNLRKILDSVEEGRKLRPIEAYDMINFIADAVLSGGIRRAALISAFSLEDQEMLTSKFGTWYVNHPQRARSNNSAVLLRHRIEKDTFLSLFDKMRKSGSGEPAFYFSNDSEYGVNPCNEASLRPFSFCNLTEIDYTTITSQKDFNERCKAAAFLGTLQASYTNFHFLREIWKRNTERDALIGVSMTGLASPISDIDFKQGVEVVREENIRVANLIDINPAARLTCVKPAGTSSIVLGTSSGIHSWHGQYYIRRIRLNKDESVYTYLEEKLPALLEEDFEEPVNNAVLSIPIKAPEGSILREKESAIKLLERIKKIYSNWVKPGHNSGNNTHNVSATVSLKENDWDKVGEWLWENKEFYNGISFIPYDNKEYHQMPFESCDEEKYNELMQHLTQIDMSMVIEEDDNTDLKGELSCAGGACSISHLGK